MNKTRHSLLMLGILAIGMTATATAADARRGADDIVNGVKVRGDGSVDDNQARRGGRDRPRGADDNLPRHSGLDDVVGGVKVRGDGSIDDNSVRSSARPDRPSSTDDSGRGRGRGQGRGRGGDDVRPAPQGS